MIKFSVIIPTYNRAHTLKRAIDSVLAQTYRNYELIIVNDGSTDNTDELLKAYDTDKLRVLNQDNQGVSKARNNGVGKSRGEWLCFLDSDDEWLPNKLELQASYIEKNQKAVCVHGEEVWIRNGVRVNQMKKHKKGGGDQFIPSLKLCLISPSTVCLRKDVFLELGEFREDYEVCEDYDLWLKLTAKYTIGFIDEPLIKKYGGHEDQLSQKFFAMDYWRVKSIDWILSHSDLIEERKKAAIKVLSKKASVLLKGYIKHNNRKDFYEIESIQKKWAL